MRAHVRFALYRDVLQVLSQLEEPCAGASEKKAPGEASELTAVLAVLATLTAEGSSQRTALLQCLEGVLAQFGVVAPYTEAPEMLQAA
jgi:hypothetical protein